MLQQPCERFMSNGCRQLIAPILRAYPRMMAQPDNLPPFVHPLGCSLHHNQLEENVWQAEVIDSAAFTPLKPLAACMSIAQIFSMRTANSADFLWRSIDSEQQRFEDEAS